MGKTIFKQKLSRTMTNYKMQRIECYNNINPLLIRYINYDFPLNSFESNRKSIIFTNGAGNAPSKSH